MTDCKNGPVSAGKKGGKKIKNKATWRINYIAMRAKPLTGRLHYGDDDDITRGRRDSWVGNFNGGPQNRRNLPFEKENKLSLEDDEFSLVRTCQTPLRQQKVQEQ